MGEKDEQLFELPEGDRLTPIGNKRGQPRPRGKSPMVKFHAACEPMRRACMCRKSEDAVLLKVCILFRGIFHTIPLKIQQTIMIDLLCLWRRYYYFLHFFRVILSAAAGQCRPYVFLIIVDSLEALLSHFYVFSCKGTCFSHMPS